MKNHHFLFAALLFAILPLAASGRQETVPQPEENTENIVIIRDYKKRDVEVKLPVESIVTMNSGLSEIVAALGCSDLAVGRCSYSTFPSSMRRVPVVGKNSSSPNMETILQLEPDLVIADSMFDKNKITILENRGISVIIESTSNPDRLPFVVENLGIVLNKEERADEILSVINKTLEDVKSISAAILAGGKEETKVFFENRKPYKSASSATGHHSFITWAGGMNIAADEPVKYPALSPEFIAMANPEVIVRRVSGDINEEAQAQMIATIKDRPSLQSVQAFADDRIYTIKSDLFISLRYPAGVAYYTSLFYPDQFPMAEAVDVYRNLTDRLYGPDEWSKMKEVYVYPAQ